MKNIPILLAYKDEDGQSQPDIISGKPAAVEKIFLDAVERHIFPSGCRRIVRHYLTDQNEKGRVIFISEDAAASIQAGARLAQKIATDAQVKSKAERESAANFAAASRLFQKASSERNIAVGKVAAIKESLKSLNPEAAAKLQKSIDAAQKDADDKAAAFDAILKQMNVIRNPKSTFDEKQAAYVALEIVKAPPAPEAKTT